MNDILSRHPDSDLFLAGDFNSCIGDLQDYIPSDDLQFVFGDTEYPINPFDISRQSKDETCSRFGTSLVDLCCTYNIHVLNGRLFKAINGEIICVANNGRSIVDYMVASTSISSHFTDFEVGSEDFSDHFPLHCKLSLTCPDYRSAQNSWQEMCNKTIWNRFSWKKI